MISIKDYMEAIQYKITSGSEFTWQCFGYHARYIDSERLHGKLDYSASIVFDTHTHEVYLAEVYDYNKNLAYRLINPEHKEKYTEEAKSRGVDLENEIEDIQMINLETDDDWIKKASAITNGEEYDDRISFPVNLPDDELLKLCMMAHAEDMSLNDYIAMVLTGEIERLKGSNT